MNDKLFALAVLRLLSAIESWAWAQKSTLPVYLAENIDSICDRLEQEILK